ncbi:MAG: hypothetical protein R3C53_00660 [Pirellulaceae bacterium]
MINSEHEALDIPVDVPPQIDEALVSLSSMLAGLLPNVTMHFDQSAVMEVEEICLEIPVELDVLAAEDQVLQIGSSPPVYFVDTSVPPVLHQMKITIQNDERLVN